MAKKDEQPKIPNWSIHVKKGIPYYRIQTYDADGRRFDIYGRSEQEVKQKYLQAHFCYSGCIPKPHLFYSDFCSANQNCKQNGSLHAGLYVYCNCTGQRSLCNPNF